MREEREGKEKEKEGNEPTKTDDAKTECLSEKTDKKTFWNKVIYILFVYLFI